MCVGVRGSVRECFLSERFARLCKKISVWRRCRDALGNTKFLRHHFFGRKPFVLREVVRNSIFLGNFYAQNLFIHVEKPRSFHIMEKSLCTPQDFFTHSSFETETVWNLFSQCLFITQRLLVLFPLFLNKNYMWWILKLFFLNFIFFF